MKETHTTEITFYKLVKGFRFGEKEKIIKWLSFIIKKEKASIESINYIFVSDAALLKINKTYLNHNNYTDIITFPYKENGKIFSDIFISIDRVRSNAKDYGVPFPTEIKRVIVHGLLHLIGHDDKQVNQKKMMIKKEDEYLDLFSKLY